MTVSLTTKAKMVPPLTSQEVLDEYAKLAEVTPASIAGSGTLTITPAGGDVQRWVTNGATTLTVSGFASDKLGQITLLLEDSDTNTVTYPAGFWIGDAPTATATMLIEIVSPVGSTTGKGVALDLA